MNPRDFCRYWFGYTNLTTDRVESLEMAYGYKRKCVNMLCQLLGLAKTTVDHWGAGLDFPKCPQKHRERLAEIYRMVESRDRVLRLAARNDRDRRVA